MVTQPQHPPVVSCFPYKAALKVALVGGINRELVSNTQLTTAVPGVISSAGRSFNGTSSSVNGCVTLQNAVSLAGSWTSIALVTLFGDPTNYQCGLWREGSISQGTTYCIAGSNANGRRVRLRVNATDVIFYEGPSLPPIRTTIVIAYRWRNQDEGAVWWQGIKQIARTSSASSDANATLVNIGWQYGPEEKLGHIHGFLHFNSALPHSLLQRVTTSPADFWRFYTAV
jgi:hypothetical protein